MDKILEWVVKNKEWLFSGLGIVIIVGLFSIIRKLINRQKKESILLSEPQNLKSIIESPLRPEKNESQPALYPQPTNIISLETLRPDEIYKTIKDAPLLQQDDVTKHYIGLKVKWEGDLLGAENRENDIARMLICVSNEYVHFNINKNDYPGLGLLKRGAILTVEGIIEYIGHYFELKDAKIISITSHRPKSPQNKKAFIS